MEKIKEKVRQIWSAITFPDGIDKEYDCQCDEAFLKLLDKIYIISWAFFGVVASISIYLLITREIL